MLFRLQGTKYSKMTDKVDNIVRHAEVSEKAIERYLSKRVTDAGGLSLKYSNPGTAGYPDRVCMLPNGDIFWAEIKSKGEKPRRLQSICIDRMRKLGQTVYVFDSKAGIDTVMQKYGTP